MAIGNGKLVHKYFPKHSRMGTAVMKSDKETEEEGKQERVNIRKYSRHEIKDAPTSYL